MEIEIQNISLHHLNLEKTEVVNIDISSRLEKGTDITNFINKLLENIFKTDKRREFEIPDEPNDVMKKIEQRDKKSFLSISKELADKLLKIEIIANEKQKKRKISEIQKGSLLQIDFLKKEADKTLSYSLISKIEHGEFLDEESLLKKLGISFNKMETLKYFLSRKGNINVDLGDTNSAIAKYWWSDFFGLLEVRDDTKNTELAISYINNIVNRKIKTCQDDVKSLKEGVRNFFKTQDKFSLEEFKNHVIGAYTPKNKNFDLEKIRIKIDKLVENRKIDSTFSIDKEVLKREIKKYDLGEGVHLTIPLDNLEGKLKLHQDDRGNNFLMIKVSDEKIIEEFSE